MKIDQENIIKISPTLQFSIAERNVVINTGNKKLRQPLEVLKLISVFSTWKTVKVGFAELSAAAKNKKEWFALSGAFNELLKHGFFVAKDQNKITFGSHNAAFDAFPVHVRMLNDKTRTHAFQNAIKELVTPNDVVLDIGTGNGILAATAALCGAKHVYAVERTEFIEVARAVFKANGLEDKITLIKGDSKELELPEKATMLVSEIIGNDPFDEGILATFKDAKERLLTSNAKIIPRLLKVYATLLEMPEQVRSAKLVTAKSIAQWKEWYEIDFSVFNQFVVSDENIITSVKGTAVEQWKQLAPTVELVALDFRGNMQVNDSFHKIQIQTSGELNAVLISFDAVLSDQQTISTLPGKTGEDNHWVSKLHQLSKPLQVEVDNDIVLHYALKNLKSVIRVK